MKRYKRCAALVLLLTILIVTACGNEKIGISTEVPKTELATVDSAKDSILIWAWDDTFNVKAAKMAVTEYKKEHPDVNFIIETKEREEILSDTKTILAAKVYDSLPDVIMIEDYDVQDVLELYEDEFVDLTEQIDYDKYVDFKRELCAKDGASYGIPFDCGTAALFYRLDILERAGYSKSDMQNLTWDKYMEIGKTVYAKTGVPMLTLDPTDFPLVRIIMQSCGSWYVKPDGTTADIADNLALKQSLQIYEDLLANNLGVSVNGWNEFISAFQQGNVASVISGGWIISNLKEGSNQSGKWRIAQIPTVSDNPNATAASNVGGSAWYILKNSHNSQAATDFMITMFDEDKDFMNSLITEIGIVPSVKDPSVYDSYDAKSEFFGGQQATKLLTEMAAQVPTVNYGSKTYELEDILENEFQGALSDGSIDECLARTQIKAEVVARD